MNSNYPPNIDPAHTQLLKEQPCPDCKKTEHTSTCIRSKLEDRLDQFKQDALDKYDRGRAEHNDDLNTLNFNKEIKDEILDLVIYQILKEIV